METRSYRAALPAYFIVEQYGAGAIAQTGNAISGVACAEVDEGYRNDIEIDLSRRGWVSIGAGDQRPAQTAFTQTYATASTTVGNLHSWSAPDIATAAAGYSGGLVLLTSAARLSDLQDLAGRCATLEGECSALRDEVLSLKQNVNALVDLLQAHGIAA